LTVSSHEPRRPLLFLGIALSAWMLTTSAQGSARVWQRLIAPLQDHRTAAALAVLVMWLGFTYGTKIAGGADSYGYVSQADLWRRGQLTRPEPWIDQVPWPNAASTFAPLGYRTSTDGHTTVPSYPPGLPILMAGAAVVAGHCAMFWIGPISAALMILGTFALGRRLSHPRVGLVAALLVASSPVFLFMLPQPMSDVPVTAAWTLALLWVYSRSLWSAGASGLASGLGSLIRPNLAPLAIIPLGWLVYKAARSADSGERSLRRRQVIAYLAGIAPGALVLAFFNWQMFGSPLKSGYGDLNVIFAWENLWPNLKNYVSWFADLGGLLPIAGLAALCVPRLGGWPETTDRSFLVALGLFIVLLVAQYCAYAVFDAWWYLRFLLPGFPLIMLGFAQLVWRFAGVGRVAGRVATVIVLVLVVRGAWRGVTEWSFDLWQSEYRYVATSHLVRDLTPANSIVIAGQHSGAVRYYAGRMTLNWGWLDREWLDRAVAFFEDHGVQPYVLLDDWEARDFAKYFEGQATLARLSAPPVLEYLTSGTTRLFELRREPRTGSPLVVRAQRQKRAVCYPPAPLPAITLK